MSRASHAVAILGNEFCASMSEMRVLIVGAGGIGCELVKNVVLSGFQDITLLDLDTIDLSNLNRQFLFRKKDVKRPKALVSTSPSRERGGPETQQIAAQTVASFNPTVKITPIYGNIKEPQYDLTWFKTFQIVFNALDNLDARRHVNRMCIAAGIPLIESGTAGYLGQVQPLMKDRTECFDCIPKPTPKSFPVCTIRSTPSAPIHCIVWAKSYLFSQLFGESEDDTSELDAALAAGENANEIAKLREEATAFQSVRSAILSPDSGDDAATIAFDKVFRLDIERLLIMHDMWKHRRPPTALDHDAILSDTFYPSLDTVNGSPLEPLSSGTTKLKDQRQLSLKDNVILFDRSLLKLAQRLRGNNEGTTLSFDKDDEDALDFVTATANLRAWAYGIPTLTRWQVKEMAGNIIPAIATTNAIIAGLIVLQAFHLLRTYPPRYHVAQDPLSTPPSTAANGSQLSAARNVFIQNGRPSAPLGAFAMMSPNPQCAVCRDTYLHVPCDASRTTLGELVNALLEVESSFSGESPREVCVFEEGRVLSEPDWIDNYTRTLADLSCGYGKFITIVDDEERLGNVVLAISKFPPEYSSEASFILPPCTSPPIRQKFPSPPRSVTTSPIKPIPSPLKSGRAKRSAADATAGDIEAEHIPSAKKFKAHHKDNSSDGDEIQALDSNKDQILEDEGLLLIDDTMDF